MYSTTEVFTQAAWARDKPVALKYSDFSFLPFWATS
jgi:hypothetical protein